MVQKNVHTFLHRRDWGWEGFQRLKTLRKSKNPFCGAVWIIYGATYDFVHACQVWQGVDKTWARAHGPPYRLPYFDDFINMISIFISV